MFAQALGTGCLLAAENQSFEPMLAFSANVFKYRHVQSPAIATQQEYMSSVPHKIASFQSSKIASKEAHVCQAAPSAPGGTTSSPPWSSLAGNARDCAH